MIDIGVNLTNAQFRRDIDTVIYNAVKQGVDTMIVTGTSVEVSQEASQLCLQYPHNLYCTAGIHPHDASTFDAHSIEQLSSLLKQKQVVAVGECGLDFNRNFSTPDEQLYCFEQQLQLAVELKMPVFLHQRDAHEEYLRLIKKYRSGLVDAVAHCFTGGRDELASYLELDLYIGITGWLCDERRGKELQDCVAMIPKDRVMVETDAPFLFPRDLQLSNEQRDAKGKKKKNSRRRNEPQYLPHIIRSLARYMDIEEAELGRLTVENSRRFFRLL